MNDAANTLLSRQMTGFYPGVAKAREVETPLQRLRTRLGLQQVDMALAAGFTDSNTDRVKWSYIENGRNKMTSAAAQKQLARALGVSIEDALAFQAGEIPMEEFLQRVNVPKPAPKPVYAPQNAPERWADLDDRYPNLAEAVRRKQAIWTETVEQAKALAMQRESDAEVGEWLEELTDIEAVVRRQHRGKLPLPSRGGADEIDVGGPADTSWRKKK